jgi:hypothetical protein
MGRSRRGLALAKLTKHLPLVWAPRNGIKAGHRASVAVDRSRSTSPCYTALSEACSRK